MLYMLIVEPKIKNVGVSMVNACYEVIYNTLRNMLVFVFAQNIENPEKPIMSLLIPNPLSDNP